MMRLLSRARTESFGLRGECPSIYPPKTKLNPLIQNESESLMFMVNGVLICDERLQLYFCISLSISRG